MNKFNNFRKKVAFLMIEGLGEKLSYASSPLLPSNSRRINNIFNSYDKKTLVTKDPAIDQDLLETDVESLINTALSSKRALSPYAAFEKDKNIFDSNLLAVFNESNKHSSSLHLLLIYSNNKKLYNKNIVDYTLKKIKEQKAIRAHIHLFVDFGLGKRSVKKFIDEIEKLTDKRASIATISGISNLESTNRKDHLTLYRALVQGRGREILSIENLDDGDFGNLLPHIVSLRGKAQTTINDFDVVVFLNNFSGLAFEILYLLNKRSKSFIGDKNIFDLKNYTLTSANYKLAGKKVYSLLGQEMNKINLFTILSKYGLRQIIIADNADRDMLICVSGMSKVLEGEDLALIDAGEDNKTSTEHILKTFNKSIADDRHDFVYAHISALRKASSYSDLRGAIEIINEIDLSLDTIVKTAEQNDYTLIIASPFSGSENFGVDKRKNVFNPDFIKLGRVPFVMVNKKLKKKDAKQFSLANSNIIEMIKTKNTIYDLAPTILDLFNIEKDEEFEGRSLTDEK